MRPASRASSRTPSTSCTQQIDAARAAGNDAKADKLGRELEGRQALLDQALKGLEEFGG